MEPYWPCPSVLMNSKSAVEQPCGADTPPLAAMTAGKAPDGARVSARPSVIATKNA